MANDDRALLLQRRLSPCRVHRIPDPAVRGEYLKLQEAIAHHVRRPRDRRLSLSVAYTFVCEYNRHLAQPPEHAADLRGLQGTEEGVHAMKAAWTAVCRQAAWSSAHGQHMRLLLTRCLGLRCQSVACALDARHALAYVHPDTASRGHGSRRPRLVEASRSHCRSFTLEECLPLSVRRQAAAGASFPTQRLLLRLGRASVDHLQSVSKRHMQRFLLFCHLLLRLPVPALVDDGLDEEACWGRLRALGPEDWLRRYEGAYAQTRRCGFGCFKVHMSFLRLLHHHILCPEAPLTVPVPRRGGHQLSARSGRGIPFGAASSTDTEGAPPQPPDGPALLRRMVNHLKAIVVTRPPLDESGSVHAFTVGEVQRLWSVATGTLEQLVLLLFLTTGLRRGGLCRLRTLGPTADRTPDRLVTTEKNGRLHHVRLCLGVRILLLRWYRHGRWRRPAANAPPSPFVFPGASADGAMSGDTVYRICRGLFERAGLPDSAHPHTFRHTYVYLLLMNGKSFDEIAKLVGHSSPTITASVYGHLRPEDLTTPMTGPDDDGSARASWRALGQFLRCPFEPPPSERQSLGRAWPPADHLTSGGEPATMLTGFAG